MTTDIQNLESGDDELDGQDNEKTAVRNQQDQSPERKQINNSSPNKTLTNRYNHRYLTEGDIASAT